MDTQLNIDGIPVVVRAGSIMVDGHAMYRAVALDAMMVAHEETARLVGVSKPERVAILQAGLLASAQAWSERGALDAAARAARKRLQGK